MTQLTLIQAVNMAADLQRAGRLQEAADLYQKVLAVDPANVNALHLLGLIAHSSGDSRTAATLIGRAVELMPDFAEAHSNLGAALHDIGDRAAAEASYRKAIECNPHLPEAYSSYGWLLQERGDFAEAERHYRIALTLKPEFASAHANLGAVLHEQHRLDDALSCYMDALACEPSFITAYTNLGGTYLKKGEPDKAIEFLRKGIEIDPGAAALYRNLGTALRALGDLQAAKGAYKRAHELSPGSLEGMESAVKSAVLAYLVDDVPAAAAALNIASPLNAMQGRLVAGPKAYLNYLNRVIAIRSAESDVGVFATAPSRRTLHVIGDSHCLSMHGVSVSMEQGVVKGKSSWVEGCKQWHLGNGDRNEYKCGFETALDLVPAEGSALVMFGEIDCRLRSGILGAWEKNRALPLDTYVHKTVDGFIAYLRQQTGPGRKRIIVCGVPAPNREHVEGLQDTMTPLFLQMLGEFNQYLKSAALDHGMRFLDTYSMTVGVDGLAEPGWHIDHCHLRPAAYAEAFERYLITDH